MPGRTAVRATARHLLGTGWSHLVPEKSSVGDWRGTGAVGNIRVRSVATVGDDLDIVDQGAT